MTAVFLIGRILFGGYFVFSSYGHFKHYANMKGYAQSKHVPFAGPAVIIGGILLLLGGLSILANRYALLGMCALIVFLIPTTIMMHVFWKETDPNAKMMERIQFMKNLALIGSLLLLVSIA